MFGGWGGMLAAIPGGFQQAQMNQQKIRDDEARRQLLIQEFQKNQRQAGMQDQLLRAQIAHMQRPDIGQMRYADERAAAIQGMQLSPFMDAGAFPQAQPMPQAPQSFGAQPQQPQPQAQPAPQQPYNASIGQLDPSQQPQQAQTLPQVQAMPQADPIMQWEQGAYRQLQQRIQALPPAETQQEQYRRALAVQQAQMQIQAQAKELRAGAVAQLHAQTESERERSNLAREDRLERALTQRGENQAAGRGAAEERSQRTSLTAQRDAEVNMLRAAVSNGELSIDQAAQRLREIDTRYQGIKPGTTEGAIGKTKNSFGIPDKDYQELEAAVAAKFQVHSNGGYEVPPNTIITLRNGAKYKFTAEGNIEAVK